MTTLRVGFAQRDITPPLGLPLGGYGARTAGAEGARDPLFCRTAVFTDGAASLAIVLLDLIHVFGEWVAAVRQRACEQLGMRPDHVLIAATHTHAGPGVFRSAIVSDERVAAYEGDLVDAVITCLTAAHDAAAPADLRTGSAVVGGIAANRRDATLPIDTTVRVLSAHSGDGQLRGVLANFACHPTVLSAANLAYSADLFGAAAATTSRALAAPVVITNGAAGDVSTRFTRREQTYAEVERLGEDLGAALRRAVDRATPVDAAPLVAVSRTIPVRWRALPAPADAAAQLQAALAEVERLRADGGDVAALRLAQSRLEGAQAALWVSIQGGWDALFGPRRAVAEVQALRLGDTLVVAAPGELFSAAGQWVQRRLGGSALVVGYANDYLGYFIPAADARAGGYEALIAMVDPACEASVRQALVDAAQQVRASNALRQNVAG